LDRGVGREPAIDGGEAIAALQAAAEALRVEACGEVVAGKGEAVGRHPMVGEGERRGEIGRAPSRRAVDAGLERIALAATHPLPRARVGARAGERGADYAVAREMVVEPGRAARGARGKIVAADDCGIA